MPYQFLESVRALPCGLKRGHTKQRFCCDVPKSPADQSCRFQGSCVKIVETLVLKLDRERCEPECHCETLSMEERCPTTMSR
jgi:hypothetical protein